MANKKKEEYRNPNLEALERYLREIAFWEQKEQEAIEKGDYSARDWARSQLYVKRTNCKALADKIGAYQLQRWRITIDF
jgi:hypothetical protein